MTRLTVAALLALGLAGCTPTLKAANEVGGVVENGTSGNAAAALKKADAHCRQYGKAARVSGQNVWDDILTFDCVKTDAQ